MNILGSFADTYDPPSSSNLQAALTFASPARPGNSQGKLQGDPGFVANSGGQKKWNAAREEFGILCVPSDIQ